MKKSGAQFTAEQRLHRILRVSRIKYPRLLLLIITIIVGYLLVRYEFFGFGNFLSRLGYGGTLIAGILFSYGFTAALATAFFLSISQQQNVFATAIIGGIGAFVGDAIIFYYLKFQCSRELKVLSREHLLQTFSKHLPSTVKKYLLVALGGIFIASPLPDEIGVSLLAASNTVSARYFAYLSFALNTIGIFMVLMLGRVF